MTLREKIQFYLIDCTTLPGRIIDISVIIVNLLACGLFVAETYGIQNSGILETGISVFFITEYAVRLYGAKNRILHLISPFSIIDMLAILPAILLWFFPGFFVRMSFIRIVKALRIFRFLRFLSDEQFFFGSVSTHFLRIIRLIFTIIIIFFVSSGIFWQVEQSANSGVNTFGDAFYYTVVTLSTVGFGDITPKTEAGRWITVIMIISGIILIPWQAGQIAREWLNMAEKKNVVCCSCGLKYHDTDASHCKSCGSVIYQEFEG